jgi:hypothetical protein
MRRLTTFLAAGLLTLSVAACQLLPFSPSDAGSDGQSPGFLQSPGGETLTPDVTVPASAGDEPASDDPAPSPSIEIPPPID